MLTYSEVFYIRDVIITLHDNIAVLNTWTKAKIRLKCQEKSEQIFICSHLRGRRRRKKKVWSAVKLITVGIYFPQQTQPCTPQRARNNESGTFHLSRHKYNKYKNKSLLYLPPSPRSLSLSLSTRCSLCPSWLCSAWRQGVAEPSHSSAERQYHAAGRSLDNNKT